MKNTGKSTLSSLLNWHFSRKQEKNKTYSLRAFARDLGIPASNLSDVFKNKRGLSNDSLKRVCEKLRLTESEKEILLNSKSQLKTKFFDEIESDQFEMISNPKYLAILCLTHIISPFKVSKENAQRLNLELNEFKKSVDKLVKANMLKCENDEYYSTGNFFVNPKETKSIAVQDFHHKILTQAQEAITSQPIDAREFNMIVFPTDTETVQKMKEKIRIFRNEFENEFGLYDTKKNKPNAIYGLGLQLFRIDKN